MTTPQRPGITVVHAYRSFERFKAGQADRVERRRAIRRLIEQHPETGCTQDFIAEQLKLTESMVRCEMKLVRGIRSVRKLSSRPGRKWDTFYLPEKP